MTKASAECLAILVIVLATPLISTSALARDSRMEIYRDNQREARERPSRDLGARESPAPRAPASRPSSPAPAREVAPTIPASPPDGRALLRTPPAGFDPTRSVGPQVRSPAPSVHSASPSAEVGTREPTRAPTARQPDASRPEGPRLPASPPDGRALLQQPPSGFDRTQAPGPQVRAPVPAVPSGRLVPDATTRAAEQERLRRLRDVVTQRDSTPHAEERVAETGASLLEHGPGIVNRLGPSGRIAAPPAAAGLMVFTPSVVGDATLTPEQLREQEQRRNEGRQEALREQRILNQGETRAQ